MDVLVYSRAAPHANASDHGPELDERHWSYMDRFADAMTARGPTLGPDRETWTGSLHVVDLPGLAAATEFVEREPYNRAGLFAGHLIRSFDNLLGRTMWQFVAPEDEPRFLVLAQGPKASRPVPLTDIPADLRKRMIIYGALRTLPSSEAVGTALALQAPDRGMVAVLLGRMWARPRDPADIEIHDWEFGGRR